MPSSFCLQACRKISSASPSMCSLYRMPGPTLDRATSRWPSNLQWIAPQVVDPDVEEVEGVEEDYLVVMPVPDEVKVRPAVRATGNRLAIDHTGLAPKPRQCFHDKWEPLVKSLPGRL